MISFYVSIAFFLFIYIAMLWFVLVWAVLAAILNPSVFLPYTAAALTLIGTFAAKFVIYKSKFEELQKSLQKVVMDKLGETFKKVLEKA